MLEIPIKVTVNMKSSARCQNWVGLIYKEPVDRHFENVTDEILRMLWDTDSDESKDESESSKAGSA